MNSTTDTIRKIVTERPESIPVLERMGIDYCCGGERTLAEACAAKNVEPSTVMNEINNLSQQGPAVDPALKHWPTASFQEITGYIVKNHHTFEREQSERICRLTATVDRVHGADHPELRTVRSVFDGIAEEMKDHFAGEEQILFPHLVKLEGSQRNGAPPTDQHLEQRIKDLMGDHDQTGNALHEIRELTKNYELPSDACTSYEELFRSLKAFEQDVHHHVHLENNILFPRAMAMATATA